MSVFILAVEIVVPAVCTAAVAVVAAGITPG